METAAPGASRPVSPLVFLMVPATGLLFIAVGVQVLGSRVAYALVAPAVALVAGAVVAWPALREAAQDPERAGKALVLAVMPETSLILAFAGTFFLLGPEAPPLRSVWSLVALGAVAAATILVQAMLLRVRVMQATTQDGFRRFLLPYYLVEIPMLVAFVAVIFLR